MVICADAPCWTNGIYQLSNPVTDLWYHFLWGLWFWINGLFGTQGGVLCSRRHLGGPDHLESYLAPAFLFRSIGMVLEEPYLLEEAKDEESE